MTDGMTIPDLGAQETGAGGLQDRDQTSDGRFRAGQNGVRGVWATGDGKVELVAFADHTLAHVRSALGYGAYYPVHPVRVDRPVQAVLMDLDGTSVKSETFWVWIIEQTIASLMGDASFELEEADLPFVSGHSVSEHLQYCIDKYCPDRLLEEARRLYFVQTDREMRAILEGTGRQDAFVPAPGLKEFLLRLKDRETCIALVTSGLYEKAWPEIISAFRAMGLGDPRDFYDAIVTAGFAVRRGEVGTLGELSPKPHPWLYAEACRVGLGIPFEDRAHVIGLEDSAAGICSIRLAGFAAVGMADGNIAQSGVGALCAGPLCADFDEVFRRYFPS